MNGTKRGDLNIHVNHQTRALTFEKDIFNSFGNHEDTMGALASSPTNAMERNEMESMSNQLGNLASKLHVSCLLISKSYASGPLSSKKKAFLESSIKVPEEHKFILARLQLSDKKKYLRESEHAKVEAAEVQKKLEKQQKDQDLEKTRLVEEQKKRESERLVQIRDQAKKEEQKKLAESLPKDIKSVYKEVKFARF